VVGQFVGFLLAVQRLESRWYACPAHLRLRLPLDRRRDFADARGLVSQQSWIFWRSVLRSGWFKDYLRHFALPRLSNRQRPRAWNRTARR